MFGYLCVLSETAPGLSSLGSSCKLSVCAVRAGSERGRGLIAHACASPYRADNQTLDSYAIAAGQTIHMVLQLRGGSVKEAC